MEFKLPEQVNNALGRLQAAGFSAYIVGGSVRDFLMGLTPADYDIATSATPQQTEKLFADKKTVETGLKHGTVTVIYDGMPLEITTFRTENEYSDGRHPDSVHFAKTYRQDAMRRDFTVNAMAYNPSEGVIDFFDGRSDIENRVIRCVGSPDTRFKEDALRIMRAVRFAAVCGFDIESETAAAARRNKSALSHISGERILAELKKLLCGEYAEKAIMEYYDILGEVIPEVLSAHGFKQYNPYHIYDVLHHIAVVVQNTPPKEDIRLAAFFHDMGKPFVFTMDENGVGHFRGHQAKSAQIAAQTLKRLKADNETVKTVVTLAGQHDFPIEETRPSVKKALKALTPEIYFKLISLKRADNIAKNPKLCAFKYNFDYLENTARDILKNNECYSLKGLAVNGGDVIAAGIAPGENVGAALDFLLCAVIDEKVQNEKNALMAYLKNHYAAF